MRLHRWAAAGALLCASLSTLMPACKAKDNSRSREEPTTSAGAAISVQTADDTDVSGFSIVVTRVSCNGEPFPAYSNTYESAALDLDISVKVTADGSSHTFADTFLPLEAGCYDILSIPKKADGTPSDDCAIAGQDGIVVFDGLPTEVVLVSQCNGQVAVGAGDVISLLNRPPQLVDLEYPGGKFVAHCDDQQICATFKDPDGDPLEVMWTKVLGLPGSTFVVGMPAPLPDGSVKQCVTVDHAGPEMMLIEAKAYDLLKNPNEPGLIRFEQYYADLGIPSTSHDTFLFQAYGANSGSCPCAPNAEVCDGVDNDCDGQNDDGLASCFCTPLVQAPCYEGVPAATLGVGECNGGIKVCAPDGSAFGPCIGQVTPKPEVVCPDGKDNDCDGVTDNCCVPEAGQPCVVPGGLGACAQGTIECDGTCMPPEVVPPETCNGIDDDCNGVVDDNLPLAAGLCFAGVGACQVVGILECQGGAIVCDAAPPPPQSQEICGNGVDDDCNGLVDDCDPCDPNAGTPCSVAGAQGACAPGHVDCFGVCLADSGPQAEVCNGMDDDCDGQTDEGLSGGACSAGVGACQATGQQVCMGGAFVCNATPGQPMAEVCGNSLDEDCDGVADDGCPGCVPNEGQACVVPNQAGACAAGLVQCNGTCQSTAQPSAEVCDGADNNCDGQVDEGLTGGTCQAGTGACLATGTFVCSGGTFACNVMPGVPQPEIPCNGIDEDCNGADACQCVPSTEVCDGADNDCDGQVDESLTGGPCSAGIGACAAAGQQVCAGGTFVCSATPGQPQAEVCGNAVDEDCNGVAETCGGGCVPNAGQACSAPGKLGPCAAGAIDCFGVCQSAVQPSAEVCNAVDDDCDGQTDEGLSGGACSAGIGACQSSGQQVCVGGMFVCGATPGQPQTEICGNGVDEDCDGIVCICNPTAEVCDGADNDCDGQIDEGLTGGSCSLGLGACAATGQQVCQNGAWACGAVQGQPSPESCNAVDDDCDGQVDEGLVSGSCSAGAGACQSAGQLVCSAGSFVCDAVPGQPQAEIQCNGIDEDCNGSDLCAPACDPCAPQYNPYTQVLACSGVTCVNHGGGLGTWTVIVDASLPGSLFTCQQDVQVLNTDVNCNAQPPQPPQPPACDPCTLCDYSYDPSGTPGGHCWTLCHNQGGGNAVCLQYYFDPAGSVCQALTPGAEQEVPVTCN
jgi:hypothetical protein